MLKKLSLRLLVVLLTLNTFGANNKPPKVYTNETYHLQFTYPGDWLPDKLEVEGDSLTIYSANAFDYQEKTLELICGIKVELYFDLPDEELAKTLDGSRLCYMRKNDQQKFYFYCLRTENCLMIMTPIERNNHNHLFIAYIPKTSEQEEAKYTNIYNNIIVSLAETKSDSDN